MKIVFWLSLIGILYTYVGYPVAMWMLAKLAAAALEDGPNHSQREHRAGGA